MLYTLVEEEVFMHPPLKDFHEKAEFLSWRTSHSYFDLVKSGRSIPSKRNLQTQILYIRTPLHCNDLNCFSIYYTFYSIWKPISCLQSKKKNNQLKNCHNETRETKYIFSQANVVENSQQLQYIFIHVCRVCLFLSWSSQTDVIALVGALLYCVRETKSFQATGAD